MIYFVSCRSENVTRRRSQKQQRFENVLNKSTMNVLRVDMKMITYQRIIHNWNRDEKSVNVRMQIFNCFISSRSWMSKLMFFVCHHYIEYILSFERINCLRLFFVFKYYFLFCRSSRDSCVINRNDYSSWCVEFCDVKNILQSCRSFSNFVWNLSHCFNKHSVLCQSQLRRLCFMCNNDNQILKVILNDLHSLIQNHCAWR